MSRHHENLINSFRREDYARDRELLLLMSTFVESRINEMSRRRKGFVAGGGEVATSPSKSQERTIEF